MNHKRRRPKSRRAGCQMCKPHKANANKDRDACQTMQERRAREAERLRIPSICCGCDSGFGNDDPSCGCCGGRGHSRLYYRLHRPWWWLADEIR